MLAFMDERSRVLLSTLLGAALGGVAGYLYLTEQGRHVRGQIEPTLDGIVTELEKARATGEKVREVAREGQRTLNCANVTKRRSARSISVSSSNACSCCIGRGSRSSRWMPANITRCPKPCAI